MPAAMGGSSRGSGGDNAPISGTGGILEANDAASTIGAAGTGRGGAAGGTSKGGTPELLLGHVQARAMATDGTMLFWTTALNELSSVPLAGGTASTLLSVRDAGAGAGDMRALADTPNGLFALAATDLYRCTSSGTASLVASDVQSFATDDEEVYWCERGGAIRRMPLQGGSPEPIATNPMASPIGVHDQTVYFEAEHDLYRVPRGGEPQKLGYAGDSVSEIAFDSSWIYLVLRSSVVVRMPYDGSAVEKLYERQDVSDLQVVGGYVYFLAKDLAGCGKTDIDRYSPTTLTVDTLLAGWQCVYGYTVLDKNLYFAYYGWSDSTQSALYRMSLP